MAFCLQKLSYFFTHKLMRCFVFWLDEQHTILLAVPQNKYMCAPMDTSDVVVRLSAL